jgi:hypothetical protein
VLYSCRILDGTVPFDTGWRKLNLLEWLARFPAQFMIISFVLREVVGAVGGVTSHLSVPPLPLKAAASPHSSTHLRSAELFLPAICYLRKPQLPTPSTSCSYILKTFTFMSPIRLSVLDQNL